MCNASGGACNIDCGADTTCRADVSCTATENCAISCDNDQACLGAVRCVDVGVGCAIDCAGVGACDAGQLVSCAADETCSVECAGNANCLANVTCNVDQVSGDCS